MEIKGLLKEIIEKDDFDFSTFGSKNIKSGSVLKLETEEGEIINVDFPDYHPGIADRKFLIGEQVKYNSEYSSIGGGVDSINIRKDSLKVLTGSLEGEKFENHFTY